MGNDEIATKSSLALTLRLHVSSHLSDAAWLPSKSGAVAAARALEWRKRWVIE